jgi:hypothetical protein
MLLVTVPILPRGLLLAMKLLARDPEYRGRFGVKRLIDVSNAHARNNFWDRFLENGVAVISNIIAGDSDYDKSTPNTIDILRQQALMLVPAYNIAKEEMIAGKSTRKQCCEKSVKMANLIGMMAWVVSLQTIVYFFCL